MVSFFHFINCHINTCHCSYSWVITAFADDCDWVFRNRLKILNDSWPKQARWISTCWLYLWFSLWSTSIILLRTSFLLSRFMQQSKIWWKVFSLENWWVLVLYFITDVSREVFVPVNRYGIPNSCPKLTKNSIC